MKEIIINLQGEAMDGCFALSSGYGYMAYTNSDDSFFNKLMAELSVWSGATGLYRTINGEDTYRMYELNCQDKDFFKSLTFRKICKHHNVRLVIQEDDAEELKRFSESVRQIA